jgi:periplasmic protein TonB
LVARVPTLVAESRRRFRPGHWLGAFALHAALAGGLLLIRRPPPAAETIAIEVIDPQRKKKNEPPKPPPPPPAVALDAPTRAAPPKGQRAPAPAPVDSPAPSGPSVPAGDLSFSNSGEGSLPVPAAGGRPAEAPARVEKTLVAEKPKAAATGDCGDPLQKAKPRSVPQPAYPEAARSAKVEGKVRVEVTLDANGRVTGARVVSGLGHGLDEAALSAARAATFSPASQCGRDVPSTFVIGMRFSL